MAGADTFDGSDLDDTVFDKARMVNARFNGVDLSGASFYAVLTEAVFSDCNMQSVTFDDANMSHAVFNDINLSDATFTNINMQNVAITDANLQGMRINGILVTDLLERYESR